jgi:Rab GDP dissociation inhibitor
MGFFEKRKFRNFLIFLQDYDKTKPSTFHKGKSLDKITTRQLYEDFGLDANTQSFTGHAIALFRDDDYLDQPAEATADAIQLYAFSLERYGKSPYIYPMYGLGGMPEGFSRLCAIHGGTFMLNKGIDEVLYENGVAWGVKTGNEVRFPFLCGIFGSFQRRSSCVRNPSAFSIPMSEALSSFFPIIF